MGTQCLSQRVLFENIDVEEDDCLLYIQYRSWRKGREESYSSYSLFLAQ